MILLLLKLSLFLTSFLGYVFYIQKKGIHIAFAPVLTVSGIGAFMFLAGILNCMPMAARILFIGGFALVFYLWTHSSIVPPSRVHPIVIGFFLLLTYLLAVLLFDAVPTHYDNFTHWLLVVRDMLIHHQLPNFQSELILFQSYPTGTACFIYYVCRVIGNSEGAMLIGQAIILVSCLTVFWAFVNQSTAASLITIPIMCIYALTAYNSLSDLLVDTVLACLGFSQFAVLWYYKDDIKKAGICGCLIGIFLTTVKNSGLFFVAVHAFFPLLYVMYYQRHRFRIFLLSRTHFCFLAANLGIPVIFYYLWYRHVKYVFSNGTTRKHSMMPQYLMQTIGKKDGTIIKDTIYAFFQRAAAPKAEGLVLLILLLIYTLVFITTYKISSAKNNNFKWCLCWSIAAYLFYQIGLLGMYLFSMPHAEAIRLASYDRYLSTISIYLAAIAVICFLPVLEQIPKWKSTVFPASLCILLLTAYQIIPAWYGGSTYTNYTATTRYKLRQIIDSYDFPAESRFYLIGSDDGGFLYYLSCYEFFTTSIYVNQGPDLNDAESISSAYDYLIVMHESSTTEDILSALGLPSGETVYDLSKYR